MKIFIFMMMNFLFTTTTSFASEERTVPADSSTDVSTLPHGENHNFWVRWCKTQPDWTAFKTNEESRACVCSANTSSGYVCNY
jgi:hypothetical protein